MLEPERVTRALRELRSLCAEVGQNDPEAFAQLVGIRAEFDQLVKGSAKGLADRGYSARQLAVPLGVGRQAVWERYLR